MRHTKVIFYAGLMTALVGLAGCAGKIRYPSYYVLNVPLPRSANDPPKQVLGRVIVREFSAPRFLREGSIAYRPSPEQLDFYNYHRWAEDPRRVVTQAMAREIQARGLFESVGASDNRLSSDWSISGTLDHLEEVDQGSKVSIEVNLSAQLTNLRTGEVLWQGTATKTATLDQRSVAGVVSAMSRELGSAVTNLASSMQDRLAESSSLAEARESQ
jgi:cholesterol transport system auxiliary component